MNEAKLKYERAKANAQEATKKQPLDCAIDHVAYAKMVDAYWEMKKHEA